MTLGAPPALRVTGLSKAFGGQQALDTVALEATAGEVHCLLGPNGSGKSTLIKILAGFHQPDAGSAWVGGEPFHLGSAAAAHHAGIRIIHQDLAVIDALTVWENLGLGQRHGRSWWLSESRERRAAKEAFAAFGVDVDPGALMGDCGSAQRTMTAIVRALRDLDPRRGVLVLDEPTASLTENDKERLFDLLRSIRAAGGTILYVTHRLSEIFEIGDRVTVLRDGANVGSRPVAELDRDSLVRLITGRELAVRTASVRAKQSDVPVLALDAVVGRNVAGVSLEAFAGEVVGITGLVGSGAEELLHLAFGSLPADAGTVTLAGTPLDHPSPRRSVRAGIALVPGDRSRLSGFAAWTLRENLTLPSMRSRGPLRWMDRRHEAADAAPHLRRFDVRPDDPEALFSALSGGNQQKVVIARWIRHGARVLLLEDPTAGVDVAAKREIYDAVERVAADGGAVLLATSDFEEACLVCQRVIVMQAGRIVAELTGADKTSDNILHEALGTEAA